MKTIQICENEKEQVIPCQLEKLSNRPCSMICALTYGCPVMSIDSHDTPIVKKLSVMDLEPLG